MPISVAKTTVFIDLQTSHLYRLLPQTSISHGRVMTVTCRSSFESVHVRFTAGKWHWGRVFSEFLGFPLSISFHRGSPYSYNLPSAGWTIGPLVAAVQRQSHAIDMSISNLLLLSAKEVSRVAQSVVCLATGWTTRRSRFHPRLRRTNFSSSLCVQTGSGDHPASCTMCIVGPFPGAKARPGRDADHSAPTTTQLQLPLSPN
jgi:hypothetical protein